MGDHENDNLMFDLAIDDLGRYDKLILMTKYLLAFFWGIQFIYCIDQSAGENLIKAYRERQEMIVQRGLKEPMPDYTNEKPDDERVSRIIKYSYAPMISRMMIGTEEEKMKAIKNFSHLFSVSKNKMFTPWTFTVGLSAFLPIWDKIPNEDKKNLQKMLENWNYLASSGTLNMRLYLYTAGYLSTQYFDDFKCTSNPPNPAYAADYRDKEKISKTISNQELQDFCRNEIYKTFNFMVLENGIEHSKVYFMCDLEPISLLREFAKETEMKNRAKMVMDDLLINLATDYNQGLVVEPCFREKYFSLGEKNAQNDESVGWLFFGADKPRVIGRLPYTFLRSGYDYPEFISKIANDRSKVIMKRETSKMSEEGVCYKTFIHTPDYSLVSGVYSYSGEKGIKASGFKEQRLVRLGWLSDSPGNTFCVFQQNYSQPYFNKFELNHFGSGENPYSQAMQNGRTIVGIYNVPQEYEFYKQYTVYSRSEAIISRLSVENWEFCHTGKMMFAFYSYAPTSWENNVLKEGYEIPVDIRWCDSRKNAWVIETAEASDFAGESPEIQLKKFSEKILSLKRFDFSKINENTPEFSYKSIYGDSLRICFKPLNETLSGRHFINEKEIPYKEWPLIDSPWVKQSVGSPLLYITVSNNQWIYDFKNWTIKKEGK